MYEIHVPSLISLINNFNFEYFIMSNRCTYNNNNNNNNNK